MKESMPGTGPRACLAPLPYTLFGNHHVVFWHVGIRCNRQVMKHRSRRVDRHLGDKGDLETSTSADHDGNEDVIALRRAIVV